MTLPVVDYLNQNTRTEGEMKLALEDFLKGLKQVPGAGVTEQALTLSTDAITPAVGASGIISIDTEAAAAADNLANIVLTNVPDGSCLLLRIANNARVVTVKHLAGGSGQLSLRSGADLVMSATTQWLCVKRTGTLLEEQWRSGKEALKGATADGLTMTGGINEAVGNIAQHATLMDIFAVTSPSVLVGTGAAVVVTNFVAAPQGGPERSVYFLPGTTITHGGNISVLGNASYVIQSGDCARIRTITATTFIVEIIKQDGTAVVASPAYGLFRKVDPTIAAFTKTGAFTISTATTLYVEVAGLIRIIAASTAVTMPGSPAAGTDYAIWAKTDGTLEATSNFVTPPTANARKIGGFHYAPGGNATGVTGGDTTPAINAYSIWDLKFRPACPDPRGMSLVADGFWADIYLLGVDHPTNGTSKYNVTIADGSSPPKIPTKFGGNGSTAYGSLTWWECLEVLASSGKRPPSYSEFGALAYGTTEAASAVAATDPVSTILRAESTSKWGVMLSTGNLDVWGANFGGGTAGASWVANTGGRGSTYQLEHALILGGNWANGALSGSRCSDWGYAPPDSNHLIGGRGVCDHLVLD